MVLLKLAIRICAGKQRTPDSFLLLAKTLWCVVWLRSAVSGAFKFKIFPLLWSCTTYFLAVYFSLFHAFYASSTYCEIATKTSARLTVENVELKWFKCIQWSGNRTQWVNAERISTERRNWWIDTSLLREAFLVSFNFFAFRSYFHCVPSMRAFTNTRDWIGSFRAGKKWSLFKFPEPSTWCALVFVSIS